MPRQSQLLGSAEHYSPLSVSDLTVFFGDLPPIVSNVSFDLDAHEILCIRGPSGAGKSRLLRAIAGLDSTNVRRPGPTFASARASLGTVLLRISARGASGPAVCQ